MFVGATKSKTYILVRHHLTGSSFFPLFQLVSYGGRLEVYLKDLVDLTFRVALLESDPGDYIKLDFELLRIELREFEALVTQLKDSFNSSSPMFDSLYTEVRETILTYLQITWLYSYQVKLSYNASSSEGNSCTTYCTKITVT